MTVLSEFGMSEGGITNSTRICSRHDHVADSVEISGKDDSTVNFTCEEQDQALPRRGPSSGTCSWLPLRGSQDKDLENCRQPKEEELCQGHWQAGHEEEEQCQRSWHTAQEGQTGVTGKQGLMRRRHFIRDPCTVLSEEGTLWRERARAMSQVTLQRMYISIPSHHRWMSGSSSTLHHT